MKISIRIIFVFLMILAGWSCVHDTRSDLSTKAETLLDDVMTRFRKKPSSIEFDALAHYCSAELNLYELTGDERRLVDAEMILDYLISTGDLDHDEYAGWGLRFCYDSFRDGTTNPETTVYTITTSKIGDVFYRAYCLTHNELYLGMCEAIRFSFLENIGYWEDENYACFWYSNQPFDKRYFVHNVNISALKFLVEIESVTGTGRDKRLIDKALRYERDTQIDSGNWYYCENTKNRRPNDLAHWAKSTSGFYTIYELTGNEQCLEIARRATSGMIREMILDNGSIRDNSSLGWGVPLFLMTLNHARKYDNDGTIDMIIDRINRDIDNAGRYRAAEDKCKHEPEKMERVNARMVDAITGYLLILSKK